MIPPEQESTEEVLQTCDPCQYTTSQVKATSKDNRTILKTKTNKIKTSKSKDNNKQIKRDIIIKKPRKS